MNDWNSVWSGFSLRESLYRQGVTVESVMRAHLALVYDMIQSAPSLDIRRYRVNKNDPNGPINIPEKGWL